MMKRTIYPVALAIATILSLGKTDAQPISGSFMEVNPDPYMMSMGNAGTAMNATAFSMWNNTASTVFSQKKMDVGVSYGIWQPGLTRNNVIAAAGYGNVNRFMSVSAGVKYFSHDSYEVIDGNGTRSGYYSPKEMTAGIGLAFKFARIISLSANVNYVLSDVAADYRSNGVSADFGAMVNLKFLRIGVTASNIGTDIDYGSDTSYYMPANVKLGLATTQKFGKNKRNELSVSLQAGMLLNYDSFFAEAGIEYRYNNLLRIAAGYHYGDAGIYIPQYASVGLGIKLWGVYLNGAYLIGLSPDSPLGNTFSIGVGFTF